MPIFEYVCKSCGEKFEKLILSASRERSLTCPVCGSREVKKAFSTFGTGGSSSLGAASASSCAPGG